MIRELRNSLDTLRLETDKQATAHQQLATQVRQEIETPIEALGARQAQFKKSVQAATEKFHKTKTTQESYVHKAREKYEADCLKIDTFTARSTLVQGRELGKMSARFDRARQTVTANEKDFQNFANALQETLAKWEGKWKVFCNAAQDLAHRVHEGQHVGLRERGLDGLCI